jgi:hypothetical protein
MNIVKVAIQYFSINAILAMMDFICLKMIKKKQNVQAAVNP